MSEQVKRGVKKILTESMMNVISLPDVFRDHHMDGHWELEKKSKLQNGYHLVYSQDFI